MINLGASDVRGFLSPEDFAPSKHFYLELGCKLLWSDDHLALFQVRGQRFYLQKHYVRGWAENCMLRITVKNAHFRRAQGSKLIASGYFPGARVSETRQEPHGALVTYVWDPAGVLLHLTRWTNA